MLRTFYRKNSIYTHFQFVKIMQSFDQISSNEGISFEKSKLFLYILLRLGL